ncbi:MAG: CaiB/BaiF CoA-transferase family protein [Pseudomonadota bacterium]
MIAEALSGLRVLDLSANAPGPFASTLLADLGARVTRIVNPAGPPAYAGAEDDPMLAARGGPHDALARGKDQLPLDLKSPEGCDALLDLVQRADVLISEMRPGKLEALGLGWETLSARNPALILCEITGYGRAGPLAQAAGHDLNYLALSGVLSLVRDQSGKPVPPQNLMGDYAAGGSLAVTGILAALIARTTSGKGQHLTLSMTEGLRYLASDIAAASLLAGHSEESWRGTLGGGMPTYDCYRTADGQWLAVAALEPKFIANLSAALDWPELSHLMARKAGWPEARAGLIRRFAAKDRAAWDAVFAGVDACVTPLASLDEATAEDWPDLAQVLGQDR